MGAAASNRGNRVIARQADEQMPAAQIRAERRAHSDETERLRAQVALLERDLKRACRALAAERYAREKRVDELKAELSAANFGISTLCRIAFPGDKPTS